MENTPTWNIEQVWGSDRFYNEGNVAQDMVAFVIDSGVSNQTNDLNLNSKWSKSFVNDPNPWSDKTGHGTAVASIIGSLADQKGLTGVAPGAQIVSLKVFGETGSTSQDTVVEALEHARDVIVANDLFDRAVINLSLGRRGLNSGHKIVQEMADMGIKFAVAAGNSSGDVDGYSPSSFGDHENVYAVSASTEDGSYAHFTNWEGMDVDGKDDIDYAAPGFRVPTYNTDGTIGYRNGTSFSAPHVAGLLLMSDSVRPGQTFNRTAYQEQVGMIPDPLGMFDPYTYKHGASTGDPTPPPPPESIAPTPEPIVIEVPVPGPVVEVPIYIEVPGPVVEVPVYPPQTTFVGKINERNNLSGSDLDDVIIGGEQKDVLRGNGGDDLIIGNGGKDKVYGGEGSDTFVLSIGDGYTIIKDFDPAVDIISVPSDDLEFVAKGSNTKLYSGGDLVARINANLDTLV